MQLSCTHKGDPIIYSFDNLKDDKDMEKNKGERRNEGCYSKSLVLFNTIWAGSIAMEE